MRFFGTICVLVGQRGCDKSGRDLRHYRIAVAFQAHYPRFG